MRIFLLRLATEGSLQLVWWGLYRWLAAPHPVLVRGKYSCIATCQDGLDAIFGHALFLIFRQLAPSTVT